MKYDIVLSPEADQDLKRLSARERAVIRDAIEKYLRFEPGRTSRSRIKRLRGLRQPEYRLRIGEIRIYYDVNGNEVEILAIVAKPDADAWLSEYGEKE
jgi:mRNA-degrading endonuclease RelE of RelBE toxin-antitoxin system